MTREISMSDLGIENDNTRFIGETPGDLVQQVVEYLRSEYDMDLPDASTILGGDVVTQRAGTTPYALPTNSSNNPGMTGQPGVIAAGLGAGDSSGDSDKDETARVIVRRLQEALDVPGGNNG